MLLFRVDLAGSEAAAAYYYLVFKTELLTLSDPCQNITNTIHNVANHTMLLKIKVYLYLL